jgi:pyruvate dehydrogenase E1 component alpha subunit
VFRVPAILFCQNNFWAISVPLSAQVAAPIWRRAEGYGFPGVRVDGNDVLAVYSVTRAAVERARAGQGSTLIEAVTYRMGPHTTADDSSRYRSAQEVEALAALDPIVRFRSWLAASGNADEELFTACEQETAARVGEIRAALVATPAPDPSEMFEWTFASPPESLSRQREEALGG